MTTELQRDANRKNARASTGPRSPDGKARSSRNALRHGLRVDLSGSCPVLPGESAAGWAKHRDAVVADIVPAGPLEMALAERVALCLWRLNRTAAYEAGVSAAGMAEVAERFRDPDPDEKSVPFGAVEDPDTRKLRDALETIRDRGAVVAEWAAAFGLLSRLTDLPDDSPVDGDTVEGVFCDLVGALPGSLEEHFDTDDPEFLAVVGVPAEHHNAPYAWRGWTAGAVRQAVRTMAQVFKTPATTLIADALGERMRIQEEGRAAVEAAERQAQASRKRLRAKAERQALRAAIPSDGALDRVTRYEAHLTRQLQHALATLDRLRESRPAARPAGPPAPRPALNPPPSG